MEKTSDKRIKYAIGIIGIFAIFFAQTTYASPFLLKLSGASQLDGFLFFINRIFIWIALIFLMLYVKYIEREPLLLWVEKKHKILFSIVAIFAILIALFFGNILISKVLSLFVTNITSPKLQEFLALFKDNIPLLLFTVATAAIVEELIFRGYIQPRLEVIFKSPILGIVGSAFLFALLHLSYATWLQFVVPLFMGLVFAIFYWKYRNIKILIICHFFWDLVGILSMLNMY